jgi:pre-mRNA cleavage complex 2 protein Pcf11
VQANAQQPPAGLVAGAGPAGPYQLPQQSSSVPPSLPYQPPAAQVGYGASAAQPKVNVESLLNDLRQVIAAGNAELAQSPWDTGKQTRLKALVDLQALLQSANLPEEQLVLLKNQVAELAVNIRAPNALAAPPPHQTAAFTHTPTPPPVAVAVPPSIASPASATPAAAGVSIDSLFGSGALAALLASRGGSAATPRQSSTPTVAPAPATIRSPLAQAAQPAQASSSSAVPSDALSLVSLLRKQGLLPASGQVGGTPPAPAAATVPPPPPPASLSAFGGLAQAVLSAPGAEIPLKASALKQ